MPGISPTLSSKRLKELEVNGLVERVKDPATGTVEYLRTRAAIELEPIIEAFGKWAYCNTDAEEQLLWLDPSILMWNLRRTIDQDALPRRRVVLQFRFLRIENAQKDFSIVSRPGVPVDVCFQNPGFDVDLYVTADLKALAAVYFAWASLSAELYAERISLIGNAALKRNVAGRLGLSSYTRSTRSESLRTPSFRPRKKSPRQPSA